MSFSVTIKANFTFEEIRKEFIAANDAAITNAAAIGSQRVKPFIPVKSGRMAAQVAIRFFKQRNKMRGASIQVLGDRHFVAHILEYGTKDKRIQAQGNFAKAFAAIETLLADTYSDVFFRHLSEEPRGK